MLMIREYVFSYHWVGCHKNSMKSIVELCKFYLFTLIFSTCVISYWQPHWNCGHCILFLPNHYFFSLYVLLLGLGTFNTVLSSDELIPLLLWNRLLDFGLYSCYFVSYWQNMRVFLFIFSFYWIMFSRFTFLLLFTFKVDFENQ